MAASDARPTDEWTHTLGAIVSALARAGLRLEFLHEHPIADWQFASGMQCGDDGYYRFEPGAPALPLMYSIKARSAR